MKKFLFLFFLVVYSVWGVDKFVIGKPMTSLAFAGFRSYGWLTRATEDPYKSVFASQLCWDLGTNDADQYPAMVALLRARNPEIDILYFHSASTYLPASANHADYVANPTTVERFVNPAKMTNYMIAAGSTDGRLLISEGVSVHWPTGTETRYIFDMTQAAVRAAIIAQAIAQAQLFGLDGVGFDNCYWETSPYGTGQPAAEDWPVGMSPTTWAAGFWNATADCFVKEAYAACHAAGLIVVFNFALSTSNIPEMVAAVSEYADGIMLEDIFHGAGTTDPTDELTAYENALKATPPCRIFLIAVDGTGYDRHSVFLYAKDQIDGLACTYNQNHKGIYLLEDGVLESAQYYYLCP